MANVLALVSFKIYPAEMGGQKGVALFYKYLQQYHRIVIACSTDNPGINSGQLQVLPVLFPNRKMPFNIFRFHMLSRIIEEKKIECIIAEHSYTGWIAKWLSRKHHIPFIIHSHNIEASRFRQMNRKWWRAYLLHEKRIFRKADFSFFIHEDDRQFALRHFNISQKKTMVVTYGMTPPHRIENAGTLLREELKLSGEKILYFNGTLDYKPNSDGLEQLIKHVLPLLDGRDFPYKLVVTGRRLPAKLEKLMEATPNLVYKGYVENVNLLYQGADVFLNPVLNDSGIKAKLVEALANSCPVVSTVSGATGLQQSLVSDLMITVADGDWNAFAEAIIEQCRREKVVISDEFLKNYSWENITRIAAEKINELTNA